MGPTWKTKMSASPVRNRHIRQFLRLVERHNLALEEQAMADYHINIFYSEEDAGYIADIPDLESCSAFGRTPEAALAAVE